MALGQHDRATATFTPGQCSVRNEGTEPLFKAPGDDVYANGPVASYLPMNALPEPGNYGPIVEAVKGGKYFVVTGDGESTTRTIVSAKKHGAFGTFSFRSPFDGSGQAWVRFAAWDAAGNGAITMPVRLQ